MKRSLQAAALFAVLLLLGGAWFLATHEYVDTKEWTGPTPAARANPYLAAMRFAERLGFKTSLAFGAGRLESPPPGAALLLPAGRGGLSPPRARALDRWLRNGGHAIVEPEAAGEIDTVLDQYGIKRTPSTRPVAGTKAETARIELPGADAPIVVARRYGPILGFERNHPDISSPDEAGVWLASLRVGAGRLTVVSGLDRFDNRGIGSHDHAQLLRRVLALQPSARELVIVRLPNELPLWGWLHDHALPTLTAAAVLMLLWLARILRRFGPIRPEAASQRRQLREHLLATGRFRWSHGGRAGLLDAARDICQRHVAARHPRLARAAPERRWPELAARTGLDATAVATAFGGEARGARDFVHIVGTLASIHASIGRPLEPNTKRPPPS